MGVFTSPPLIVNEVMAWANDLFGGRIPLLPLPSAWGTTLPRLWRADVPGNLPDPDSPKPWRIEIDGTWQPFASCDATFESLAILVADIPGAADAVAPNGVNAPPRQPTRAGGRRSPRPRRVRNPRASGSLHQMLGYLRARLRRKPRQLEEAA